MELLKPAFFERDNALEEYDKARALVKSLEKHNHNNINAEKLEKAETDLEARTLRYNTLNTGIIDEVSSIYTKNYEQMRGEYSAVSIYSNHYPLTFSYWTSNSNYLIE
jgi:hypothetical protein